MNYNKTYMNKKKLKNKYTFIKLYENGKRDRKNRE